jgi:host factor-I protein
MITSHLQDTYLSNLQTDAVAVSLYLINGIKLIGQISGFDEQIVLLKDNKSNFEQLIYKHAISTIVPNKTNHSS